MISIIAILLLALASCGGRNVHVAPVPPTPPPIVEPVPEQDYCRTITENGSTWIVCGNELDPKRPVNCSGGHYDQFGNWVCSNLAEVPQFILDRWPNAQQHEGIYYAGAYEGVPIEKLPEWFAEAERRVLTIDPGPIPNLKNFLVVEFKAPDATCDDPRRFKDTDGDCVFGRAYGYYIEASAAIPNVVIHEMVHEFWFALHPADRCADTGGPVWYCVEHGQTRESCRKCDPFLN